MENELTDFIVTAETVRQVEEYDHPSEGYELIIGIPAVFTPVCREEMEKLNNRPLVIEGPDIHSRIVMLDNPHAIREWLVQNGWTKLEVLVSKYAAEYNDLATGDLDRPISRTMVVNFYERSPFEGTHSFFNPLMTTKTTELLRLTTHMDIPRNFEVARDVILHHAKNRI